MTGTRLRFGLLGPLLVTATDTPVALGTPKQRAVFAMLLINRNRAVGTESLIDATWDQSPVPAARTSIHAYVSHLRRLLGAAGVDPNKVLASAPSGYRLSVADGDCDLDRFITDKTAGMRAAAAGRFEQASSQLSAALDEWRGPVLDDLRNFAFVEAFATALAEDYMLVRITRAEAEIACGRAKAIIAELEVLAAQHPYHEPLWAQLMTAYYVAERQSDALEAYRRLKATLAEIWASTRLPRCGNCTRESCAESAWTPSSPPKPPRPAQWRSHTRLPPATLLSPGYAAQNGAIRSKRRSPG